MKFNCRDHDEFPMKVKINCKEQISKDHFYFRRKILRMKYFFPKSTKEINDKKKRLIIPSHLFRRIRNELRTRTAKFHF